MFSSSVMAPQSGLLYGVFQPSLVPDVATAQTIDFMCNGKVTEGPWHYLGINHCAGEPIVQAAARDAVARFSGVNLDMSPWIPIADSGESRRRSSANLARAVFWWVKYAVEPMRHSEFKALIAAFPEKKQLIVDPIALLGMPHPAGDCSAFTMLVCALLRCLGVRYELVTVAADPEEPALFTHVYPQALIETAGPDARVRLALDVHAGKSPGWEVPAQDVFRRQVWSADGQPIPDQASRFTGLHEYVSRGFGDDASDVTVTSDMLYQAQYGDTAPVVAPTDTYNVNAPLPSGSFTVPSPSNSAAWANAITAATKAGLTLAELSAIQPGTVVGPNGQILRQAAGYPVGSGVTAAFGSGGGTMLLLLAGVAVVVLLMRKK